MKKELSPNTTISHYRVVSQIGAGGMGEVYKAHDSRLDRAVAIKMLPADLSSDDDRLTRFEQEAKATSALNHPNILTVYDIGEHDGSPFIVSELLDGEELRERLEDGPIPVRKAIDYAQQIVSGLTAAHEKGIVHRDLKPENLFITNGDRVKILDFGLAKLRASETDIHGSEDATRRALTNPGVVMGTVGYMSPEQVRGHATDQRSDIFSFGVILYEMLTGSRAFSGDSVVELMNAILKEDVPELENDSRRIPPSLDKIMRRCLEKKPDHRFYSAHDLGFALEALSAPSSSSGTNLTTALKVLEDEPAPKSKSYGRLAWVAAGLFLISTLILSALYFRRVDIPEATIRFALTPPEKMSFGESLALSPDGTKVAYLLTSDSGELSLWVRPVGTLDGQRLQGTEGASFPFWSPDSKAIGFFAFGKLKKVDANGGPVQTIAEASTDPRGGTWGKDGTILFTPGVLTPIYKVSGAGGAAIPVTELDTNRGETSHRWPYLLPDGQHFLYFARGGGMENEGVAVGALNSSERKLLFTSKVAAVYAPPASGGVGHLLTVNDGMLISQPFDEGRLELTGERQTIAQDVRSYPTEVGPTASLLVSVSNNGHLAYRTGGKSITQLQWVERSGKASDPVAPQGMYHEPMISPDGKRIIVSRQDGDNQDLWMFDTGRNIMTRFTFDLTVDTTGIWDPAGANVIYTSFRDGKGNIYRKAATGLGNEELLYKGKGNAYPDAVSPDGKYLLLETDNGAATKYDVEVVPLDGDDRTPIPIVASQFTETHAQFSPDGRWVSYVSDESGRAEVYIRGFGSVGGQWQISTSGGDQPMWNPKGKEIFYLGFDRTLYSVPYEAGESFQPGKPETLFPTRIAASGIADERNNYLITPDGQRFFLVNTIDESRNSPIVMVLNWRSEPR